MRRFQGRKFRVGFSLVRSLFDLCAGERNGQGDGLAPEGIGGAAIRGNPDAAAQLAPANAEALVKGDEVGGGHDQPSNQTPPRSENFLNVVW